MGDNKGQEILKSFKRLQSQRSVLEQTWKEAFEYSYPLRGQGFYGNDDPFTNATRARTDQAKLFDSTGTDACRLLSASMIGGLTPSTSQWFSLSVPNTPDAYIPRPVRAWLQQSSETLFSMIHSSNYNAEAYEFFIDIAVAGQAGLFIEMNEESGRLHFEHWPLASLYIADSTKAQKVDTVYRRLMMTVAEAAEKFGAANLPPSAKSLLENDPTSIVKHPYIHCIRPRFRAGKRSAGKMAKAMPFESTYVCEKSGEVCYESGYQEFPLVIPRWSVIPGTEYAVGPLNDALPDVKTLNKLVEMVLTNGEMAIAGTFVAKHDGVFNPSTVRIGPRKVIMVADPDNIKPLASGGNWRIAEGEIMRLQGQIKRVMMSDELAPSQSGAPMTAEEVRTRTQIIRQILGPTFSRLQAEFLNPLIERCFNLAFRAGLLGQPPDELMEMRFIPEFKSPLARAQRMDDVTAMDRYESSLAQSMQAFGPQVADTYDVDKAAQKRAEILGIPVELMRDQREIDQIRQQRAQAEAEAAQREAAARALSARPEPGQANELVDQITQ
ncbi:phage tail protein [Variovorax sp. RO1]|uniref:portal protein n=1 Tax=Variovorax sp. RO1 TaxID=2066034 RepID=UPI000C717BC1|nr:portal protein [Variovorax sp. RO1]PLC03430.1 phage tail protein [Variovorax sp. RO1]